MPARKEPRRIIREVVGFTEVPYGRSFDGALLTNLFAVLACGHRRLLSKKYRFMDHTQLKTFPCGTCARQEEGVPDGGE